jgi:hypothetical protein
MGIVEKRAIRRAPDDGTSYAASAVPEPARLWPSAAMQERFPATSWIDLRPRSTNQIAQQQLGALSNPACASYPSGPPNGGPLTVRLDRAPLGAREESLGTYSPAEALTAIARRTVLRTSCLRSR